jgi:O-antigen biosynthesis protein
MQHRIVTVAIPVLNGAEYLDEVLAAVREQRVDADVEVLIVDSGSSDSSVEIARRHGERVHEIAKAEFSHGGTRNLIMQLARGEHVAFLTQDATPAHDRWLASLLEGFDAAEDVGAVFGPHDARPEASHVIKAEMDRHFATWGNGATEVDVQRIERSPEGLREYRQNLGRFVFLSSVNMCVARWAWEEVRFREVPYAEDQLFGRQLLESGHAKVFHPQARVLHSHHYKPTAFLRRYFDEFRGLHEVLGYRESARPRPFLRALRGLCRADKEWLQAHGIHGPRLWLRLMGSFEHHTIRLLGAILGSRAGALPPPLRKLLSLEGRASFDPVDDSTRAAPNGFPQLTEWSWNFVRPGRREQAVTVENQAGLPRGPFTTAWVVPPWGIGSGGHAVIFRLIAELERRGHKCALFVFDPFVQNALPAWSLRDQIIEHFTPIEAEVFIGLDDFSSADVAVATNWWTAYPVRDLPGCREKVYLVQDYEPAFYPTSAEAIWAEDTYRMGYRCLVYTPWLGALLAERFNVEVAQLECGTDIETYGFGPFEDREAGLIVAYARQETPRRAVELALAGLATLIERRPNTRVVLYGSNLTLSVPFECEQLGVIPPRELANLYRRANAGLVFSLTNLSLVTQEMMASGLPVIELDGQNVSSVLGRSGDLAMLSPPEPDAIADAVASILDDPDAAKAMALRARRFAERRTWDAAADQLEAGLAAFLASPRPQRLSRGSKGEDPRFSAAVEGALEPSEAV